MIIYVHRWLITDGGRVGQGMRPQLLSSGEYDYMFHLYSKGYVLKLRALFVLWSPMTSGLDTPGADLICCQSHLEVEGEKEKKKDDSRMT